MKQYHALLMDVMASGEHRGDRTGTGTQSLFGHFMRHDMADGFPLMTSKRVPFKSVAAELLWFLRGETNIKTLLMDGCTIWTDWPYAKFKKLNPSSPMTQKQFESNIIGDPYFARTWGDLGPVYGKQWRQWDGREIKQSDADGRMQTIWETKDQIADVIDQIRNNPESRRILVSAWNAAAVDRQALPPCHFAFQFYCHNDGRLSLQFHMRSTDIFLGLPFNIASYGLLLHMVCGATGRTPGHLTTTFGDLHLYSNHRDQALELLDREPPALPQLTLPAKSSIHGYTLPEIMAGLEKYEPLPTIRAQVAV
jgi:thymidylate synthase